VAIDEAEEEGLSPFIVVVGIVIWRLFPPFVIIGWTIDFTIITFEIEGQANRVC
jgi:hypothetical protein